MSTQVFSKRPAESDLVSTLVGRPLKRKEDYRILTGRTSFIADVRLPQMLHAAVLRSPYAHAIIRMLDTSRAKEMPGVKLALTAGDISGTRPLWTLESEAGRIERPVLAGEEVTYFGEAVAFVVAETYYQAVDALEEITVEYDPLEAIIDPEEATKDASPKCHAGLKSNVVISDKVEQGNVDDAFSKATKVVRLDLLNQRVAPAPMEPRGCLAYYDEGLGLLNFWISTQGPFQTRSQLSAILGIPENRMRVFAPDVGGAFGAKLSLYSEDVLVSLASMRLKLPVKWIETRSENLSSMTHGRGQLQHVELASNDKGRILGLKVKLIGDVGAYTSEDSADATFTTRMAPGQYLIPAYRGEVEIVLTNKAPHDSYRGASRPEATYLIERAVDELAHSLKIDPAELRLRNFIPKEDFPYKTSGGLTYDSGDYSMNLKKALELSNYTRLREEQARARELGKLFGIGVSTYVEVCSFGPDFPQTAAISVSETGKITVISGTSPHGQGHETPLAQIVADKLGVDIDDIVVTYGDTAMLPWGTFTAGSRSAALGGSAVLMCAEKIRSKMAKIAAKALDVSEEDLVFKEGKIYPKRNAAKSLTFAEVSSFAYKPRRLPEGMEPVLYAFSSFAPPSFTFPFGTHIAVVEVDSETGKARIIRYVAVDDCGRVLNPLIVEGQIHGGVVQGLGQAMLEDVVYDKGGQLLSATFTDYQIPQVDDVPALLSFRTETPTMSNPFGLKGVGEAGTIAATPTIANAIRDALSTNVEKMPFSMELLKDLIGKAQ